MRRFGRLVTLVLLVALFSGCAQGQVVPETKAMDKSTLVISTDGSLTAYLVGEFDKSYYSYDELAAMAQEEAVEYGGSEDTAPVKMENVETVAVDGGTRVVVTYSFDSPDSYEEFIEDMLFYGTLEEAMAQGYGNGVALRSVKDGTSATVQELSQEQGKHFVVFCPRQVDPPEGQETEKHLVIYCPMQVEYLSEGAVVNQNGSVDISWIEGTEPVPVYILLGK